MKGKKHLNGSQGEKKSQKGIKTGHKDKHGQKKNTPLKEVVLHMPKLQTTKYVFEKILPHCVDIQPIGRNLLILKLSQTKFDDSLTALEELTFGRKKLKVSVNNKSFREPLKRLIKLPKFVVNIEELKQHYNASSIEQLQTKKGNYKLSYVLNFESEEAASAMCEKKFHFDGKEILLSDYYIFPTRTYNVKESNEGPVTKKMKTNSGAKATKRSSSMEEEEKKRGGGGYVRPRNFKSK